MDYDKIIDLDNITLEDCIRLFYCEISIVINDGKIKNLERIENKTWLLYPAKLVQEKIRLLVI